MSISNSKDFYNKLFENGISKDNDLSQEEYNEFYKRFIEQNIKDVDSIKQYFSPGNLYILLVTTPAYFSTKNYEEKRWEWLLQIRDKENNITPLMFLDYIESDHSAHHPGMIRTRSFMKTICLKFLHPINKQIIYVPMTPGKEDKIFLPFS
jgi:hypothetical protein